MKPDVNSSYGTTETVFENCRVYNDPESPNGFVLTGLGDVVFENCTIWPPLTWWDRLRWRLGLTARGFRRGIYVG